MNTPLKDLRSKGQLVVLGLVGEKERYGYEIESVIRNRVMRMWVDISFSSVYDALNKLERKRLVKSRLESGVGPGPAQKLYKLTPKGRQLFKQAVKKLISSPKFPQSEFDLGLANIWVLSQEEILDHLKKYEAYLQERKQFVEKDWEERKGLAFYGAALFERQLLRTGDELDWVRGFRQRIEQQEGSSSSLVD